MQITEEIQKKIQKLPTKFQAEILNFVQYLLEKSERESAQQDESNWSDFSLNSAMRGMEDEDTSTYTISDLKVIFSWKHQGKSFFSTFHKQI